MTKRKIRKGDIAFWSYDNFPYVLGGTIERVQDNGAVITRQYGPGFAFRTLATMPPAAGTKVKERLEQLRTEYRVASAKLQREFEDKVIDAAPFMEAAFR